MLKLRITKSISTYGEYGIIKKNVINLQVKFKVSIFGIKYYYWKTIYSTLLDDIDSIKEKDILNELIEGWLENRNTSKIERLKEKLLKKLNYDE